MMEYLFVSVREDIWTAERHIELSIGIDDNLFEQGWGISLVRGYRSVRLEDLMVVIGGSMAK